MLNKSVLLYFISFMLIFTNIGCGNTNKTSADIPNSIATIASNPGNLQNQTDKIKFKTDTGSELFSLKLQTDGAKLVDAKNNEIAKIKSEQSGKLKIKNASDKVLGYVVTDKGNWKLENPEQNKTLYILKLKNNGNYKLEDSANKEVYQINAIKNELLIQANNKLVYKVKIKEQKTSLRDASGKTVFSTKSNMSPIAFACFGFDVLTREQQAALAYAVNLTGGK
jgi:hypothetical protein